MKQVTWSHLHYSGWKNYEETAKRKLLCPEDFTMEEKQEVAVLPVTGTEHSHLTLETPSISVK